MMGLKLTQDEIEQRLIEAREHNYDPDELGELWGLQGKSAAGWMRDNCRSEYFKAMYARQIKPVYNEKRTKPEWENEWVNDFQVLTQEEYMAKYHLTPNAYRIKLCRARKEHGEIHTPKERARWEAEYWERLE